MSTTDHRKTISYLTSLPRPFFQRITKGLADLPLAEAVPALLRNIHQYFNQGTQYVTTTSNIYLSRCLPVSRIIRIRLRTCGSIVAVAVACLRRMGFQARMVDGQVFSEARWRSHSWIEVWDADKRRWIPYDAFYKNFSLRPKHRRNRACNDWSEMQKELLAKSKAGLPKGEKLGASNQ